MKKERDTNHMNAWQQLRSNKRFMRPKTGQKKASGYLQLWSLNVQPEQSVQIGSSLTHDLAPNASCQIPTISHTALKILAYYDCFLFTYLVGQFVV